MPIDVDRFEDAEEFRHLTTSERVVRFLLAHDDQAYTRREIADAIDANPETVGTNLTRLKERGLVRHREPYWAFTADRERAVDVLRARYDDAFLADLFGTEDRDEQKRRAVSPAAETTVPPHREAARIFFERVRDRLDDVVDALYLFGSLARDAATADSDVDVLAVVSDDADYAAVDDQLLDISYDVQLEYGVRVEVHSIRAGEFAERRERGDPFVRIVVEEGEVRV